MNERIKLLAEQAGYNSQWSTKADKEEHFDLEKFAELIVRECAKFLDENSGYDDSNNAWHPEPEDLLKHFGVEE
jgi:hypothetical protein